MNYFITAKLFAILKVNMATIKRIFAALAVVLMASLPLTSKAMILSAALNAVR